MVFCNIVYDTDILGNNIVTILILIDGFLQCKKTFIKIGVHAVTILILIDGFLQFNTAGMSDNLIDSHNPYFNRWFSAIPPSG